MAQHGATVSITDRQCPLHRPEDPPMEKAAPGWSCFCLGTVKHVLRDGMLVVQAQDGSVMLFSRDAIESATLTAPRSA
jgi:hypothetical protein